MALPPGIAFLDVNSFALSLSSGSYSDLVAETLGDAGADGDGVAVSEAALAALMDAYEQEVRAGLDAEDVPSVDGSPFDLAIDDAMIVEISVANDSEVAISAGMDFLFNNFGVWGLLDVAVNFLLDRIGSAVDFVLEVIANLNTSGPGLSDGGI